MVPPSAWTLLARILRPQGRKGEVLADLFTDFPERFATDQEVWLAQAGFTEEQEKGGKQQSIPHQAHVAAYWLPVGRNAGRIVLHLAGVDSITAAERLAGTEILVPASKRVPLEPGAAYISDLVGCRVYDGVNAFGTVEDVHFATTADGSRRLEEAAPLLVVRADDGEEILVPFAKDYLAALDTAAKEIRMMLPAGLTQVNSIGGE